MDRKNHLKVDKFAWDKEYNDVHQWLDETYAQHANRDPYRHWLARHHMKAISEEYGNYTPEYNVAYLHVLFDFLSHFQVAYVPVDEKDCESMLKSLGAFLNGTESFC